MTLQYLRQPAKTIYLIYEALLTLLIRIPIWIVMAIPRQAKCLIRLASSNNQHLSRAWRPAPSRSYARTLLIQIARQVVEVMDKCGPVIHKPKYTQLEESEDAEGIWVDPVDPELR
uniref:Uncharacterized protein n=1 Tax=Moniliophthora roreri TaxID=221103 RepID=A0A0W0FH73_MONRR